MYQWISASELLKSVAGASGVAVVPEVKALEFSVLITSTAVK